MALIGGGISMGVILFFSRRMARFAYWLRGDCLIPPLLNFKFFFGVEFGISKYGPVCGFSGKPTGNAYCPFRSIYPCSSPVFLEVDRRPKGHHSFSTRHQTRTSKKRTPPILISRAP